MLMYEISCMSSGDDNNLYHILGGSVSGELVKMTESPTLTTLLIAEPAECHTSSHGQCW